MRLVAALVVGLLLSACAGPSRSVQPPPSPSPSSSPTVVAHPLTMANLARRLATRDGSSRDASYFSGLRRLHHDCATSSPSALGTFVKAGDAALTTHDISGASYLSVLDSLDAYQPGDGPRPRCARVLHAFLSEVDGPSAGVGRSYDGYAATTTAFAAGHRADPAGEGGYLPTLADGKDFEVTGGGARVTELTRSFDPPLSQPVAIGVIERELLPGRLRTVYRLHARQCDEAIFLSPVLGTLLSNPDLGVMIELTSGRGISSRYDPALVDRAILSPGGRIGGQPCV